MRRLKVGIYDHHWSTLGGGEQVDASLAEVLSGDHDVTLLGPGPIDAPRVRERLGPDVSGCRFARVSTEEEASDASEDFDLFVNGSFLSKAPNRAPIGYYYVMFPQSAPSAVDLARSAAARLALGAIGPSSGRPSRLNALRKRLTRSIHDTSFASTYHRVLSDSAYTAHWVRKLWKVDSEVLYPPVRPAVAPGVKRPLIVSVGRFFDPRHGHSKKQREMVEAFTGLHRSGEAEGWELMLIGGCDPSNREYLLDLKRRTRDLPVRFAVNAPGHVLTRALSEASLYWHAGGYGEDPVRKPERFEHFGIAVVEALAAGAVPLVFGAAGPAEIVRHQIDGLHWRSLDELRAFTMSLIRDSDRRERMIRSGLLRASEFSVDVFRSRVKTIVEADAPLREAPPGSRRTARLP